MRVLVSCQECSRRYQASERKIGKKFRCHCGVVLKVEQSRGHDAAVVRCSSCGGARQEEARNCGFCGADFTLHERDLNTVCPNCLARVSDKARFCCQCGDRLSAEAVAGEDLQGQCPACPKEEQLASRRLGHENVNVLECQGCAGLWLSVASFRELRDRAARRAVHLDEAAFAQPDPRQRRDQSGPLYRPCVVCQQLMVRRWYAPGSGVIVDLCKDHGIWFDATELHQVLQWISDGGPPDDPLETFDKKRAVEKSASPTLPTSPDIPPTPRTYGERDFLDEIVTGIAQSLDRWLRRP